MPAAGSTLRPGLRPEGVAPPGQSGLGGTPGTALQRNTTWRCGIADRRHPSGVHHPSAAPLVPAEGSAQASVSMRPPYSRWSRTGTRAPYSPQRTRLCTRYPALPLLCTASTSAAPTSTTFCRSERSKRLTARTRDRSSLSAATRPLICRDRDHALRAAVRLPSLGHEPYDACLRRLGPSPCGRWPEEGASRTEVPEGTADPNTWSAGEHRQAKTRRGCRWGEERCDREAACRRRFRP